MFFFVSLVFFFGKKFFIGRPEEKETHLDEILIPRKHSELSALKFDQMMGGLRIKNYQLLCK